MNDILNALINKISMADVDPKPSDNIYLEEVFSAEMYQQILAKLPKDEEYDFIEHPDAILPDGTKTRKLLDLTDHTIARLNPETQKFWQQIKDIMISEELRRAIIQKFHARVKERFGNKWPEMVTVPILYRDFPGYHISVHTDAPYKLATLQFYFPKDNSQIHLGTSFHTREGNQFPLLKTNPFKPNSAYAFVRTEDSWHSVKPMGQHESKRDSLALTIYVKGHEYDSSRNDRSKY